MLNNMKLRLYQERILDTASQKNTLVVLPTGLGKTAIAAMLAFKRLENYKGSKILILAPTKPLAQQHEQSFKELLPEKKIVLFTGSVKPEKRIEYYKENEIIISTPQGMENDIIRRKIDLRDVSLLVLDEAHRATGNYSYNYITKKYVENATHNRVLALTASPGTDLETITEVCNNLYIQEIEYRTKQDEDVAPYVKSLDMQYVEVELPEEMKRTRMFLEKCYNSKLEMVKELGHLPGNISDYNKSSLLKLLNGMHGKLAQGEKDYEILKSVSLLAEALKVQHALELVETQGVHSLLEYLDQLKQQAETTKVKAVKNLVKDVNFRSAYVLADVLKKKNVTHPKLEKVKELVKEEIKENKDAKIIIFAQYRDTGQELKNKLENVKSEVFVGQAKKKGTGMSQKQQKEMIESFKDKKFNCLIATSVGEEGLDIPEVDLVIFYEPIPSAIRTVQRRGRTGRQKEGKVKTLITKNTRDEAYRWSAHHKEKRMYNQLKNIKKQLTPEKKNDLTEYIDEGIIIKTDYREKGSPLMKELLKQNVNLDLESLPIGDYLLSDDVVVEFKTVPDFVDSILDKRLLSQARDLKQYKKPLIIIQGTEDIYSQRRITPNAIRGIIAALTINYDIPIITTKNPKDTADFLKVIARREQLLKKKDYQQHASKPLSDKQVQEYIVSSMPGIGAGLAKPLLEKFGSIKNIVNASEEELKKVELIGEKKAKKLREVLDKKYES